MRQQGMRLQGMRQQGMRQQGMRLQMMRLQGKSRRRARVAASVIGIVLVAGVGGYLVGSSSGEDLESTRVAAAAAGDRKGSTEGMREGYARGFESGRERGYADAYPSAYESAYLEQFESAGLDAPVRVSVPEPNPAQGAER